MRGLLPVLFSSLWLWSVNCFCDRDWVSNGLYCYYVSDSIATYKEATEVCATSESSIVDIEDYYDNDFVYSLSAGATEESYWIGYELVIGTIWRWSATAVVGLFTKWDFGEPDKQGSCSCITPYYGGAWRDRDCEKPLKFVCKKLADCGVPPPMPNGKVTGFSNPALISQGNNTIYAAHTVASYTCEVGYEFADDSTTKDSSCAVGGIWNPALPLVYPCTPKKCTVPPAYDFSVTDANVQDYYDFGTVIEYQCIPGYWFHPYETDIQTKYLKCQNDKTWKETNSEFDAIPLKKCSKMECNRPVTPNSKSNTSSNLLGTIAMYRCKKGHRFKDNETAKVFTCTSTTWSPPAQECIVKKCKPHQVIEATASTDSVDYDTTVKWTCNPGHKFSDTTSYKYMYCQADEQWSGKIDVPCETMPCLNPPTNGSTTNSHNWNASQTYKFNHSITYTCKDKGWTFPSDDPTKEPSSTRKAVCGPYAEWIPRYLGDCTGDPVIIVTVHPTIVPQESPSSVVVGSLGYILIGAILVGILLLDVTTIGKHIAMMRENICPKKLEEGEIVAKQLAKWKGTLANKNKGKASGSKIVIRNKSLTTVKQMGSHSSKLGTLPEETQPGSVNTGQNEINSNSNIKDVKKEVQFLHYTA